MRTIVLLFLIVIQAIGMLIEISLTLSAVIIAGMFAIPAIIWKLFIQPAIDKRKNHETN